jgi:hypothetical protein
MKLLDFVDYLLDPAKLEDFYHQQGFGPTAVEEGLTIYMVGSIVTVYADIRVDADIRLLTFEETKGLVEVHLDGVDYVYVLEVYLAIDLLLAPESGAVTKLDQANLIVQYALYDA